MILKPYYDALTCMAQNKSMDIQSKGGSTYSVNASSAYKLLLLVAGMSAISTSGGASSVIFGTGSNPVALTDVNLSGTQITTLSGAGQAKASHDSTNKITTVESVLTVTNTGSADVTVGEVGLQLNYTGNWAFLIDRTVLDAPVTIPAGGVGQITYTINMIYPTD